MPDPRAILDRYSRTFGSTEYQPALQKLKAVIGTDHLPETEEGELAKRALAKLKKAELPGPAEVAALEVMIRMMRPAPIIQNGRPADLPDDDFLRAFPSWPAFQDQVAPFSGSIGRIDRADNKAAGSGFLVSNSLLVTNRHVLDFISHGTDVLQAGQAVVRFRREFGMDDEEPRQIVGVNAIHATLDAVLLDVEPQDLSGGRKPLAIAQEKPALYAPVAVIGYPFRDSERNPMFTTIVFEGKFGVKRAAPGEIVSISEPRHSIAHDSTTLGGNSGSPVLSLETSEVVGLHMGGSFLWRNEAVDCLALGEFVRGNRPS